MKIMNLPIVEGITLLSSKDNYKYLKQIQCGEKVKEKTKMNISQELKS